MRNNNIKIAKELIKIAKMYVANDTPKIKPPKSLSDSSESFSDLMKKEFSEITDEVGIYMSYNIPVKGYWEVDDQDCGGSFEGFFDRISRKTELNNKFFKDLKKIHNIISFSRFIENTENCYFECDSGNRNIFYVPVKANAELIKKGVRIRDQELKNGLSLHDACMEGYMHMKKIFYNEIGKI